MTNSNITKALLLGSALILTGCGDNAELKSETKIDHKAETSMTKTHDAADKGAHKGSSKALAYNDEGKTDADHIWLEEVEGEAALVKVKGWNEASAATMQGETFNTIKAQLLEVHNSPEKIPYISYRNGEAHNFWQDEKNTRGLWRKTTLESYGSGSPEWETVLDVDKLAKREDKNWVYKGNSCLAPAYVRCMVSLSDGGKDAVERREFNTKTGKFVKNGFVLSESKGGIDWLDKDNLLVGVDFGEGTMTDSGYPMIAKLWKRGTSLSEASELMRGEAKDVGTWPGTFENADGGNEIFVIRATTFYDTEYYWVPQSGDAAFKPVKFPMPTMTNISGQFGDQILVSLQEDWRGHSIGTLVSFSAADFMEDGKIDTINEVFKPGARQSMNGFNVTKDAVLMSISDNVAGSAHTFKFNGGKWSSQKLDFPENGNVSIGSTNDKESIAFINTESFLEPDTLWTIDTSDMSVTKARALPSWFDSDSMVAEQYMVASSDGTEIPYFMVHKKDLDMDGTNPTLLYG